MIINNISIEAGVIPQLIDVVAQPTSRQQEKFALQLLGRLSHASAYDISFHKAIDCSDIRAVFVM